MAAQSPHFVSVASSQMVRKAMERHPNYQLPETDNVFASLLDCLYQAEKDQTNSKVNTSQADEG